MLHEQVAELGKELKMAKEVIKNLVTQQENYRYFHPSMHIDYKMQNFQKEPAVLAKIVSEYDQEIPQSQTADNPVASRGRAAQPSRDTRKTN